MLTFARVKRELRTMLNNDVLRRLRYTFDMEDDSVMKAFEIGGYPATRAEISDWMKADEDPNWKSLHDIRLATFLNGFIVLQRGPSDKPLPKPEKKLDNNLILRKLKIALALKDEDMVDILDKADLRVSKHEVNAFFRKQGQSQYRLCQDQILRNFLMGLQIRYRPSTSGTEEKK